MRRGGKQHASWLRSASSWLPACLPACLAGATLTSPHLSWQLPVPAPSLCRSEVAAARAQHWAALKALVQDWGPDPMAVLQGEEVTVRSSICRGVAKSASLCAVARDPLLPQVLLACLQGLQQVRGSSDSQDVV